ncbi:ADP-ribosylglycohydrolase [Streptococcus oralis subsp. oralis]|uniref:ADP-ribosylglycohydrolase n=1 Tax=Streptococcus oralis subsp. oralis TaxID=1891914 RepID=A0A1X1H058_STROR|nr:ADP-ribosylglycohydrolase family protein [Streptococcus oralis]ORO52386.1 ADP-ribosylglycohydrolase [Streptococcus oralis subsp. oralis]
MLGAVIGDIVGSRFEADNHKSKEFDLFTQNSCPTDDSIMTLAVAKALLASKEDWSQLSKNSVKYMQKVGRHYPDCGYGGHFFHWIFSEDPQSYGSYGNGAAMRISAVGFAAESIEQAKSLSQAVTAVTHNHPEGIKGAEATAVAIFLARNGASMDEIRDHIDKNYYPMDFTLDDIREDYTFDVTCQGSVPQALEAFFESENFEDAIRNAISIGGDSDTIAAICGGIAEAYYGIPEDIRQEALPFLDDRLLEIVVDFENTYPQ